MQLIDTHCHLDVEEFAEDREQVLQQAREAGVVAQIVPAIHAEGWPWLVEFCNAHDDLYPALGMHPIYLEQHRPEHIDLLHEWVDRVKPVAIGEIGLDYFVRELDRQAQQVLFEQQLRVAQAFDLPVILHVRKSHDQVLATLKRIPVRAGVAHAFNGSLQQAEQYIAMGFKLGFGGMLTYERSNKIRKLAVDLPLEAMVLETDAPDMTTAAHHGERNSPAYLPEVARALAQLRGASPETIARVTSSNARTLFGLMD